LRWRGCSGREGRDQDQSASGVAANNHPASAGIDRIDAVNVRLRLTSLVSCGGETVMLPTTGVTCLVGRNNVGKSHPRVGATHLSEADSAVIPRDCDLRPNSCGRSDCCGGNSCGENCRAARGFIGTLPGAYVAEHNKPSEYGRDDENLPLPERRLVGGALKRRRVGDLPVRASILETVCPRCPIPVTKSATVR
jgi:hypothetical protein